MVSEVPVLPVLQLYERNDEVHLHNTTYSLDLLLPMTQASDRNVLQIKPVQISI